MALSLPYTEVLSNRERLLASAKCWMPWVGKGSLAITDQGLFASSNFLLNVLLARWLAPSDYGAFATVYSVFLLLLFFHTALFTAPMLVFGAGKYREGFPEYLGILLRGHFALMLPAAAILVVAAFALARLYSPVFEPAFLALAVAAPFIMLLWFLRRAFYAQLDPRWAALGGGIYFIFLVAGAFALRIAGLLSPATGFLDMGAASLIICALLLIKLRPVLVKNPSISRIVATDHWRYGKWVAASAGPNWIISNIYYILLPVWAGLVQAGALKAFSNIAMPALQTISALGLMLMPALVRNKSTGGSRAMSRTVYRSVSLFVAGSGCYLGLLWLLRNKIFQFLYAGKYAGFPSWWLLLLGLLPLAQSVPGVLGAALSALEKPNFIFWASFFGAIVTLVAGIPFVALLGVGGALWGMLASYAIMGAVMHFLFTRCLGKEAIVEENESSVARG